MADKTKTRRPARKQTAKKRQRPATTPATPAPILLDLSAPAEGRPTVRLPAGDYQLRLAEELTFDEFGRQVELGKILIEKAGRVKEDGMLEELQDIVSEAAQIILVDCPDDIARTVTPGMFQKISALFTKLAREVGDVKASETGSSDAPSVNDSTEISEAA